MAGVADVLRRPRARELERRRAGHAGVHEQHQLPFLQIDRVFDLQLKVDEQLDIVPVAVEFQPFRQSLQKQRSQGVIAPAGVADRQDQHPGARRLHRNSCSSERENVALRTVPSASRTRQSTTIPLPSSTSSTTNGIWPRAWVAQDRQGS